MCVAITHYPGMTKTKTALQYSRRWSRKDLKEISCISLSKAGTWVAVAQNSWLSIFNADNGSLVVKMESSAMITSLAWISDIALACCTANGTIMVVSLLEVPFSLI